MSPSTDNVYAVLPILRDDVRRLCLAPYPGHRKGCPNWNKRDGCPPQAPLLRQIVDLSDPVYCIYNRFDLGEHVARMRKQHPDWSDRKLKCCLYWQGTARKQLRLKVERFLEDNPGLAVLYTPEACGVDVTATMASIGIQLQWPVETVAYQVALAGTPRQPPN